MGRINDPWKRWAHESTNRAGFIKSIREAQIAVGPTSGPSRQPRGKSLRLSPYPKGTPPRYALPSEQVLPDLWDLPPRRQSVIDLTGETSEEDVEQQDDDRENGIDQVAAKRIVWFRSTTQEYDSGVQELFSGLPILPCKYVNVAFDGRFHLVIQGRRPWRSDSSSNGSSTSSFAWSTVTSSP